MIPALVQEKLDALPQVSGVYLFKDKAGKVVYVGKAKSLRSRVRSYFQESTGDTRYFVPLLHRTVGDLDTVVTQTEKEAAILENLLIKQHRPRFNVKLRDDKEYPSLKLDPRAEWAEAARRAHPRERRRTVLRALSLGHGCAPHARPREQTLPAPDLHGHRAPLAPATLPPAPDQALPGAVCLRGRYGVLRRAGARGGPLPRGAPRRAHPRARRAHAPGREGHALRARGGLPRPAPRHREGARGPAGRHGGDGLAGTCSGSTGRAISPRSRCSRSATGSSPTWPRSA
jgi:hypothetical protein